MLLLIDNYDSFTWNLAQYFGELGEEVRVIRNDAADVAALAALKPDRICVSPGPCDPAAAGISVAAIRYFAGRVPLLGVCLGHQCMGVAFGGQVARARRLMHGKTDAIEHDGRGVFRGLPSPLIEARYHSLVVDRESLPDCLEISASGADGDIQGLRHRRFPLEGVQFHPESIASQRGHEMLRNFLEMGL